MTKEMITSKEAEFVRDDDELMRVMKNKQEEQKAAEEEQCSIEVKCEAARYAAYKKKIKRAYQLGARITAALSGSAAVVTVMSLINSNALGVFVGAVSTFVFMSLSSCLDKLTRSK